MCKADGHHEYSPGGKLEEAKSYQNPRAVVESVGIVGLKTYGFVVILQRALHIALGFARIAPDVPQNDTLEVATGDAFIIKKYVISVVVQVLEDGSAQGALVRR